MSELSYYEKQKAEIATIKERNFTLKLSDTDVERVFQKAGGAGLTVSELLQNFIGDLVGGTYSNGSDERDFAQQWFERCWFGAFPERTFTQYLIQTDQLDFVLSLWDDIQVAKEELTYAFEHPEEYDAEEISALQEDITDWKKELNEIFEAFKKEAKPNTTDSLEQEIGHAEQWQSGLKKMLA